jgi:glycosyltransferase involved in cell wall biosynthesis
MRVLVVHNRYRLEGGEERAVELQVQALRRAGVDHARLERSSADVSKARAALALLRGGQDEQDVGAAARDLQADVVHAHNTLPLFGPKALQSAHATGASVVMQLHNLRLFCAIGVAARDGGPCFRCHHRNTLPGLVLNCRESIPEAAVYATALARHQPAFFESVDRFVVPSRYAAGQTALLGVPAARIDVVPHYLPADAFAESSRAAGGRYALVAARLTPEKGVDTAIEAAALADIPLHVAGEGPAAAQLIEQASVIGAPVDFVGRLDRAGMERELAEAAMLIMPSRYHEFAGYSALEAMAAGVPVIASNLGALPELVGA